MNFWAVKNVLFYKNVFGRFFSNWISLRLYFLMSFDHAIIARAISNRETSASHSQQIWDITLIHKAAVMHIMGYMKICQRLSRCAILL